ncbi:hypothetical protein GGR51DRAFT_571650 [Nemania sp. FL0031]|nr:hypothetical protein GGR51DRAFT_571650 [Nemania sp. FL0031]
MAKHTTKPNPKVDLKSLLQDSRGRDALRQLSETRPFRNALKTATAGSRPKLTPAKSSQSKQLATPAQSSLPKQPTTPAESSLLKLPSTPAKSPATVTGQKRKRRTGTVGPVLIMSDSEDTDSEDDTECFSSDVPSGGSGSDFTPGRRSKAKPTVPKTQVQTRAQTRASSRGVKQSAPTKFNFDPPQIPVPNPFNNHIEPRLTSLNIPSPSPEVLTRPSKFARIDSDQNVTTVSPTEPDDCSGIARRAYNIVMESKEIVESSRQSKSTFQDADNLMSTDSSKETSNYNETTSTVSSPSVEEITTRLGRSRLQPTVASQDRLGKTGSDNETNSNIRSPSTDEAAAALLGLSRLQPAMVSQDIYKTSSTISSPSPKEMAAKWLGLAHLTPLTVPPRVVKPERQLTATFESAAPAREQEDNDCFIVATRKVQQLPNHTVRQDGRRAVHPVSANAGGVGSTGGRNSLPYTTALNLPPRGTIPPHSTSRRTPLPTLPTSLEA